MDVPAVLRHLGRLPADHTRVMYKANYAHGDMLLLPAWQVCCGVAEDRRRGEAAPGLTACKYAPLSHACSHVQEAIVSGVVDLLARTEGVVDLRARTER